MSLQMGLLRVTPALAGENCELRVDRNCFDVEVEIRYWLGKFDLPPVRHPEAPYVELVRFAYDRYLLHGRLEFVEVANLLKKRLAGAQLRFCFDWSVVEPFCNAVWQRMAAATSSDPNDAIMV